MNRIRIEHSPDESHLDVLGVRSWPIWEKEVSRFPWQYDIAETCYLLEGEVVVTPEEGEPLVIRRGDLVTFPPGLRCTWDIVEPVRKHYCFG